MPLNNGGYFFSVFRSLDLTNNLQTMQVPNQPFSKFFKEKVSLSQKDIMENSETVNNFIEKILEAVCKRDAKFTLGVLNTGKVKLT